MSFDELGLGLEFDELEFDKMSFDELGFDELRLNLLINFKKNLGQQLYF
jgi:hypothetical protein